MKAQRAHLTGSMRVYSKVAERNSEILSSADYSDIFPSNASKSPGIELNCICPETDVSENEEDSETSTPDHEETDDEEVEMTNNKEAKENKVNIH
ncbi:hypothetical protein RhiirA4_456292 [Rhizophagus irregularis]|uniref:Uncharacterized protein n=1 Tax=Rhizophagus irregularis TaxID=588596 RepID=A0A2I1G759_9GLOM|nr:hypothetical protein RhiirA4_456292 [Rhizophagus irregularis]